MNSLKFIFFPSSRWLNGKWWHRLAFVAAWAWVAFTALWVLNAGVLQPRASCLSLKYGAMKVSELDCGTSLLDYAYMSWRAMSPGDSIQIIVIGLLLWYLFLCLPVFAYRIGLFIFAPKHQDKAD